MTKTQRERVLSYIQRRPVNGTSRSAIAIGLKTPYPATCRRVQELVDAGDVLEFPQPNAAAILIAVR